MAAEAIVSVILEQLTATVIEEIRIRVGLVAGADKAVENLNKNLLSIRAVLKDAEEKQRKDDETVSVWLDELKGASYDIDDILDEWNTKLMKLQMEGVRNASALRKKVCIFFLSPGYCFRRGNLSYEIAFKIKEMNKRLDSIARRKDMFKLNEVHSESVHKTPDPERITSSFVDVSDIYGRDEEKRTLVSMLLSKSHGEGKGLHIISIVGMGGIGKTTLAQFVYIDQDIARHFENRIWVCVSDPFDEYRIAKVIIKALGGNPHDFIELDLDSLLKSVRQSIEEKKFLLVLDDVWTEDSNRWNPLYNCLNNGLKGSKILVTTRKETVARMMRSGAIISINELSEEICWSLFKSIAFLDRSVKECEELEVVGREIVGKCKYLPLAIKTTGSLLRFKKTSDEWQRILNSEVWGSDELTKDLFPALLLSYNDLPYMIKRCFSYCAIFPKDYKMKKDQLIQLWMAQSYLGSKEMEATGEGYFNILVAYSFFQDFEKDEENNIIGCKMHDILHDFAQHLTRNECFALEFYGSKESTGISTWYAKARHSSVSLGFIHSFPKSMLKAKKLRSLLLYAYSWDVEDKLFDELTCLRALSLHTRRKEKILKKIRKLILIFHNLSRCNILRAVSLLNRGEEIFLKKIGKLIHLRYLNLSHSKLEELPETLCDLYNLQTLDISWSTSLKNLPQGMGKLINLRHLLNSECNSLRSMPIGMERLICLRTLEVFVVGREGSTVNCLKNLNNLRGSLEIRGLGNVMNVDEVKRAQVLYDKKYLKDLILNFSRVYNDAGSIMNDRDEDVLECLQPPSNLEKLDIKHYRGKTLFPNWMTLLIKLRVLILAECINCDCLPPLGKLSSLEELTIGQMSNVKIVSNEFLGIENDPTTPSSSSMVAFPKLKRLEFRSMHSWEEWDYKNPKREEEEEKDDFPRIMPCLRFLGIGVCDQLKELPDFLFHITTLEELTIQFSSILEERCKEETGDYWKNIKHLKTYQTFYRLGEKRRRRTPLKQIMELLPDSILKQQVREESPERFG